MPEEYFKILASAFSNRLCYGIRLLLPPPVHQLLSAGSPYGGETAETPAAFVLLAVKELAGFQRSSSCRLSLRRPGEACNSHHANRTSSNSKALSAYSGL